ncbi:MucB/RseB C-terminal domain-containing protein, partial [Enterobacter hormaechei subsp. steigerwaltii]|nr:MucB/RseB C-terminal domain-containing protein [Enterobacter hormaechei subsp. steigerwaltii]
QTSGSCGQAFFRYPAAARDDPLVRPSSTDQMLRTGRRTVSTSVRDNAEITIVGELPPQTAKRIAENIKFGAAQ